jgi:hypothetical protein
VRSNSPDTRDDSPTGKLKRFSANDSSDVAAMIATCIASSAMSSGSLAVSGIAGVTRQLRPSMSASGG